MTICSSDPAPLKAENTLKVEEEKDIGERVKQPIQIHRHGAVAEKFVNGSATKNCKQTERNKNVSLGLVTHFHRLFHVYSRSRQCANESLRAWREIMQWSNWKCNISFIKICLLSSQLHIFCLKDILIFLSDFYLIHVNKLFTGNFPWFMLQVGF